jgi:hypothetical protein
LYHATDVDSTPTFANPWEARQAAKDMLPRLEWVRNVLHRIVEAQRFEALGRESQALALTKALYDEHTVIKDRLKDSEAKLSAAEAKLDKLERTNKKSLQSAA